MSTKPGPGVRDRILQAADELAREVGPAGVSLDAVAARAGVSKGGLLYHFPAKGALLQALVEGHLDRFRCELRDRVRAGGETPEATMLGYLAIFAAEHDRRQPPPSGVLAALVQNPELLEPVRRFKREMLDCLAESSADRSAALVLFLALEGLRSLKLFDMDVLTEAEHDAVVESLARLAGQSQGVRPS